MKEKIAFKMTGEPSLIPKERINPFLNEVYEPVGSHLSC
jgi:hypothetical protein